MNHPERVGINEASLIAGEVVASNFARKPMASGRIGIAAASEIVGVSHRQMRDRARSIAGAEMVARVWSFDEGLLRAWVAGEIVGNASLERRRALSGELRCADYMASMRTWLREPNRIYFIQAGDQHIKIGVTFNSASRLEKLQCANALELRLLSEIDGNRQREMYLHEFFATERVRGEWFEPSERLLAYIATCKG